MRLIFYILFTVFVFKCSSQPFPIVKETTRENRQKLNEYILNYTIVRNLSFPLTDSTEDRWQDAFYAIQLINYKNDWVNKRITLAVDSMSGKSASFQASLLELLYSNFAGNFAKQIMALINATDNNKIFVMCAEYLFKSTVTDDRKKEIQDLATKRLTSYPGNPLLEQFINNHNRKQPEFPSFHSLLKASFLDGNVILISFQRKDRDYPGIVIIRNAKGEFIKDNTGKIFNVPQLARSVNGLPGYITNGNTPEGIFRMDGFDISKSNMIGPTINVQLTMPYEFHASHFYMDSTLTDSIEHIEQYKSLLPENLRDYYPLYQSYYAGKAGRSEIIAHGTTVDPSYYIGQPYYPLTPTMGCLCTMESWNENTGARNESDQQLLIDAIKKAGGPKGYAVVVNLDDKKAAVTLEDIIPLLKKAGVKL